ncbi:MAG: hypothetical protein HQL15_04880 [Candidatus Omnitrophica bacterium]|nr:hypothetical protein [Candidatus Omnitrophota bacterium]
MSTILAKIKTDLKWMAVLILPFLLWLAVYHNLFIGKSTITGDNNNYFHAMVYHFQSLTRGEFPLWMPFQSWGTLDNFDFRTVGDLNPIFLLIPVQIFFGSSPYTAFVVTMALYFWIGCLGFYLLAYSITKDRYLSLVAYILWMFSGMGVVLWTQLSILTTIVPTIWFFVFLIGFLRAKEKNRMRYAAGLTFVVMILLTTYLPFFFLTTFLCFLTAILFIAPGYCIQALRSLAGFIKQHPWVSLLFLSAVVLSAFPWGLWYQQVHLGENVILIDRAPQGSKDQLSVGLGMINSGSLFSQALWFELFSGFRAQMNFSAYIPLFAFIGIGLSLINRLRREQIILFVTGLLLFLVSSAGVAPVHKFLYEHVLIFRMFRNYFMFWQFIEAVVILYVIGELKEFLSFFPASRGKGRDIINVLGVNGFFIFFLSRIDDVPSSSFWTVILSAIWLCLYVAGAFKSLKSLFQWGMIVIVLINPMQVYGYYQPIFTGSAKIEPLGGPPQFSYMRPVQGSGFNENSAYYDRVKLFQDESGFVKRGYVGINGSHRLYTNVPEKSLKEYVRYKFVVYDRTSLSDSKNPDFKRLADNLGSFFNEALVDDARALGVSPGGDIAQPLPGPSPELRVTKFTLNTIEVDTNFLKKKFLVYNDSFHNGWQASIDGQSVALFRANVAFKGVWIQPGPHHMVLTFNPLEHVFLWCLLFVFVAWLGGLLFFWGMRWLRY